jgi:hypothetical protein
MELNNLFFRYNLNNTVNIPNRITKSASILFNVTVNEKNCTQPSIVMDLGLFDHYTQILSIPVTNYSHRDLKEDNLEKIMYRNFSKQKQNCK